jgi:hypothetical protein
MNKFFPVSLIIGLGMGASALAADLGPLVSAEELQQADRDNLLILDIRVPDRQQGETPKPL